MHALRERAEIAEKHQAKLEKELPKMRAQNQRLMAFLHDALAFMRCHKENPGLILGTLAHDFQGLAYDEPCFRPRVTGYATDEAANTTQP